MDAGKIASRALMVLGACLVVVGMALALAPLGEQGSYAALAGECVVQGTAGDALPRHDVSALRTDDPDAVAWLSVSGTVIDYPVARPPEDDPGFYLDRALSGAPSVVGCPFVEPGWRVDDLLSPVFAHHFSGLPYLTMFTELADVWNQDAFDETLAGERALWETERGATEMHPAFALRVDSSWEGVDEAPRDAVSLRAWLLSVGEEASACAEGWRADAERATSVVALVTCSSRLRGQPWRTVVVLVATS